MAWYTDQTLQQDILTLTGAYGNLFRCAMLEALDHMGMDEPYIGGSRFASMEYAERVVALHDVATALLIADVPPPTRHAYHDATVAAVFDVIVQNVSMEVDEGEEQPEPDSWRQMLLDAWHQDLGDDVQYIEDKSPESHAEWESITDCMLEALLGDMDFEDFDDLMDKPPDEAAALRHHLIIDDNFFSAMPRKVSDAELERLVDDLKRLGAVPG